MIKYKRYWLSLIMLLALTFNGFSQDQRQIDSITALLRKAEKAGNDTLVAFQLSALANSQWSDNRALAFKTSQRQLDVSKKAGYKRGIADAYHLHSNMYEYNGDYNKAIDYALKSLSLYKELGRKTQLIELCNSIGITYAKKGIYSESLKYLLQGLQIAIKEKNKFGMISTYNNLGIIYEHQKKEDEALKYYLKCLEVQKEWEKAIIFKRHL